MEYDSYNREERCLCAHLFRLLHEWTLDRGECEHLAQFLQRSSPIKAIFDLKDIKIFVEVALIRDAYFARKTDVDKFMDDLVLVVAIQEGLEDFRLYSELPQVLKDPEETHPKQIRYKASAIGIDLTADEDNLFGAIQGMFNAKPDLAITTQDTIFVYEAKFTESFDSDQLDRTNKIAEVWARLLYDDLGFAMQPKHVMATIGPSKLNPTITWEWLFDLVKETYPIDDRTYIAVSNAVSLLSSKFGG